MLAGAFADGFFWRPWIEKVGTFLHDLALLRGKSGQKSVSLMRAGLAVRTGRANPSELKHKNREGQVTDFGKGLPSEAARFAAP